MTTADRKKATQFFVRKAFLELGATASVDVIQVFQAVSDLDDWFTAAPAATEATNQAQMLTSLSAAFKNGTTATQKALLLSAVALGRAGVL